MLLLEQYMHRVGRMGLLKRLLWYCTVSIILKLFRFSMENLPVKQFISAMTIGQRLSVSLFLIQLLFSFLGFLFLLF